MNLLTPKDHPLIALLAEKIVVCDGAMGTEAQRRELPLDDYEGCEGLIDILCRTKPDIIREIHASFLDAGAEIIETNTFSSTPVVLDEYGIGSQAFEFNKLAASLAKEVASSYSKKGSLRFVSGSIGPTTKLVSLGHIDFKTLKISYFTQILGLLEGGVDLLQIETCQDPLQIKAAVQAAHEAFTKSGRRVPIFVQFTVETTGTMLVGSDVPAVVTGLEYLPVEGVGMNCATGPDLMKEHIKLLGQLTTRYISCLPNAGLPRNVNGRPTYDLTPEQLTHSLQEFVTDYGVGLIGGCCGTIPAHIKALADVAQKLTPKARPKQFQPHVSSLYQAVALDQDGTSPLIVGERTNANGSKKFKELLLAEDWHGIVELAKDQEAEGAHVIDVCTAYVGRDEVHDMREVISRLATQVTLPVMIDSTQLDVLEEGLSLLGGRSIINSINLEDGEEKFDKIAILAKRFGAALVALTIDEQGMAKTAEEKLRIAKRIYELLTVRHGLPASAILFDVLTFTIASGDEDSRRLGLETLEGITLVKKHLPGCRTILGLSNISFGLKAVPRQILNSVYLEEAINAGLDGAILNASKIIPVSQIDEDTLSTTLDLIYDRRAEGYDPLFVFIEKTSGTKSEKKEVTDESALPVEEVLKQRIIRGNKIGLELPLRRALDSYTPLDIINKILLEGMRVVGDLFGSGKMQLPFVLQSAETMKAAVMFLQQFMEKSEGDEKGTIVLATVRGDVHDIGKNLVDIILSNNGYKVHNLGIKQPLENILSAIKEHKPDAVGLSGLLVKSTVVMKENLEELAKMSFSIPVICGGAALNRAYVESDLRTAYTTGPVYYGQDAFMGLRIMEELTGQTTDKSVTATYDKILERRGKTRAEKEESSAELSKEYVKSKIEAAKSIPTPPFWGSKILTKSDLDLRRIFNFVNKKALYANQWQYRRPKDSSTVEHKKFLDEVVDKKLEKWKERIIEQDWLHPTAIYGYYPCNGDKNDLVVFDPIDHDKEIVRFNLPRQPRDKRRCISDYFLPIESGRRDMLAVHLVTAGAIATKVSQQLFSANLYDDYLHFHGLSVETAEALAEWMHQFIRLECGFAEDDADSVEQLFRASYRGSRYSFGYPACPNVEDQVKLFKLIDAASIGVSLSEEFQLEPEQSTSAIIVHHQEATYFSI